MSKMCRKCANTANKGCCNIEYICTSNDSLLNMGHTENQPINKLFENFECQVFEQINEIEDVPLVNLTGLGPCFGVIISSENAPLEDYYKN